MNGRACSNLKNTFISLFSKWRGAKNIPGKQRRFLVICSTGLGDTLWATPGVEALRNAYPNAFIAALTSPIGAQVLKHNPAINTLYTIGNPALVAAFKLWRQLNKHRFDTILLFHASQRPVFFLAGTLGASIRISSAYRNKGLDSLFTHLVPKKPLHEIERRLEMVRFIAPVNTDEKIKLFLTPDEEKEGDKLLEGVPFPVGIHPGSKDLYKRWPPSYFASVGAELTAKGATIFITGGKDEAELCQSVADAIPGAINLAGKYPVRILASLIKRFHLFLTNDTGPMHLAFWSNTPTIALFGPTDPSSCGPHKGGKASLLQSPVSCRPCMGKPCREPFCLLQTTPAKVKTAIEELLS